VAALDIRRVWRMKRPYILGILACFCGAVTVVFCWYSIRVSRLIEQMESPTDKVREEATHNLVRLFNFWAHIKEPGPFKMEDGRAVAALIAALGDADSTVRTNARLGLEYIGSQAVEPLILALRNTDSLVREGAAGALSTIALWAGVLSRMDFADKNSWAKVLSTADLANENSRAVILMAGPLVEAALTDGDSNVREQSASGVIDAGPYATKPLIAALKDKEPNIRRRAASLILKFPFEDSRAVEPLLAATRAHDMEVISVTYGWYITKGIAGSENELIEALGRIGDREMAETFLNSGNLKLEAAASKWATSHGYKETKGRSFGKFEWGSGR